jgi:tRNA pseudouridine55 synthase
MVTLHDVALTAFDGTIARVSMRVSAGFYVRSLAHDLGQKLGMGATLEGLRRTRSGVFGLADAITVEALVDGGSGPVAGRLIPMANLLPEVPAVTLTVDDAARARKGLDVMMPASWTTTAALARLLDAGGQLLAIARPGARAGFLHPFVVLN